MVGTGDLPFQQKGKGNIKIRTFDSNIDEFELKWHRDREDREVTIIESNGWKYQEDNKLPVNLKEGDVIFIPKETYHRVIKGNGDLKIKVDFK
jgi:hypothetical protein